MAEKKTPEDHKAKQETVDVDIDGLTVQVVKRVAKDWRLVKLSHKSDKDPGAVDEMFHLIFGDQAEAVEQHFAEEDGFIDGDKISGAITVVMEAISPNS